MKSRSFVVIALFALLALLAACSSSSDSDTAAETDDADVPAEVEDAADTDQDTDPADDGDGDEPSWDVCAMVSDAEIEQITGHTPVSSEGSMPESFDKSSACVWELPDDLHDLDTRLSIELTPALVGMAHDTLYEAREPDDSTGFDELAGVGDAARFWIVENYAADPITDATEVEDGQAHLMALSGDVTVEVYLDNVYDIDRAQMTDELSELATMVIEQL